MREEEAPALGGAISCAIVTGVLCMTLLIAAIVIVGMMTE